MLTFWQVQKWICCKIMNLSDPCWLLKEWHSIGSSICETNCSGTKSNPLSQLLGLFLGKKFFLRKLLAIWNSAGILQFWLIQPIIGKKDKRSDLNPCSSQTQLICFSGVKHSWNLNILYLPTYLAGAFWPSVWCKGLIKRGSTWCQIVCLCLV